MGERTRPFQPTLFAPNSRPRRSPDTADSRTGIALRAVWLPADHGFTAGGGVVDQSQEGGANLASGRAEKPQQQLKRRRLWLNDGSCVRLRPEHPNHVWSYDFMLEMTDDGWSFRILNMIDEFTGNASRRTPGRCGHPVGVKTAFWGRPGISERAFFASAACRIISVRIMEPNSLPK